MAGHSYVGNSQIKHIYLGNTKIKKMFLGNNQVWSGASVVTYNIDSGNVKVEEVDEGLSVLTPSSFTPTKSGYTFVGWREDSTASSSVISTKTATGEPITLYAVFRQEYTLTLYNGSTTASTSTYYQYYNNSNKVNPSVTLSESAVSGWTKVGWNTGANNKTATVSDGGSVTLTGNATYYSLYKRNVTVYKYNGSTSQTSETKERFIRYASSVRYDNPSFTLSQNAVSGWSAAGWTNSASGYSATVANGGSVSVSTDSYSYTYYSLYAATIYCYKYNGSNTRSQETKNRIANYHSAVTYSNPSFTLSENALSGWSKAGWTSSESGYSATVNDGGSVTLSSNATYYSLYAQSVTVTYYNNSSAASSTSKNRVANVHSSTTYSNPTFNLTVSAVSGWSVRGWSTSSAGNSGISYNSATNFTRDSSITLYASWSKTVTVSYNGNGATGGSTSSSTGTAYRGYKGDVISASITLRANGFIRTHYTYSRWGSSSSGGAQYNPSQAYSFSDSITLYALWTMVSTPYYYGSGGLAFNNGTFNNISANGGTASIGSTSIVLNADTPYGGYPFGEVSASLSPQGCNRMSVTFTDFRTYWEDAFHVRFNGVDKTLGRYDSIRTFVFEISPTWDALPFDAYIFSSTTDEGYGEVRITSVSFYNA